MDLFHRLDQIGNVLQDMIRVHGIEGAIGKGPWNDLHVVYDVDSRQGVSVHSDASRAFCLSTAEVEAAELVVVGSGASGIGGRIPFSPV